MPEVALDRNTHVSTPDLVEPRFFPQPNLVEARHSTECCSHTGQLTEGVRLTDIHERGARFLAHHCDDTEQYKPGGSQTHVRFLGYWVDDSQYQVEGPHLHHDLEENIEAPSPFHRLLEDIISHLGVGRPV